MNERYAIVVKFEERGSQAFVRAHVERLCQTGLCTYPLDHNDSLWGFELVAHLDRNEHEVLYVSTHYRNSDWIEYERAVHMANRLKLIENGYKRDLDSNPTVGDYLGSLYDTIDAGCIYVVWPEGYERDKFWYYPTLILPQVDDVIREKLAGFEEHPWPEAQQ